MAITMSAKGQYIHHTMHITSNMYLILSLFLLTTDREGEPTASGQLVWCWPAEGVFQGWVGASPTQPGHAACHHQAERALWPRWMELPRHHGLHPQWALRKLTFSTVCVIAYVIQKVIVLFYILSMIKPCISKLKHSRRAQKKLYYRIMTVVARLFWLKTSYVSKLDDWFGTRKVGTNAIILKKSFF